MVLLLQLENGVLITSYLLAVLDVQQLNVLNKWDDGVIRICGRHALIDGIHKQDWVLHFRLDHRPQLLDQHA